MANVDLKVKALTKAEAEAEAKIPGNLLMVKTGSGTAEMQADISTTERLVVRGKDGRDGIDGKDGEPGPPGPGGNVTASDTPPESPTEGAAWLSTAAISGDELTTLGGLPEGTEVLTPFDYLGEPIPLKVAKQGFRTAPANSTTMIASKIIAFRAFDAKEPTNPDTNRAANGNNRFALSNLMRWLNSTAGPGEWYVPTHEYDAPPTAANTYSGRCPCDQDAGFLYYWPEEVRKWILPSFVTTSKVLVDGGDNPGYMTDDESYFVYPPSLRELLTLGINGSSAIRYPTQGAADAYVGTPKPAVATAAAWWVRNAKGSTSNVVLAVTAAGSASNAAGNEYNGYSVAGIVPFINFSKDTPVKLKGGKYYLDGESSGEIKLYTNGEFRPMDKSAQVEQLAEETKALRAEIFRRSAEMTPSFACGAGYLGKRTRQIPMVCFTDDDADLAFKEKLLPMFTARNMKLCTAINPAKVGTYAVDTQSIARTYMTWEEIRQCLDTGLVEAANHSMHHPANMAEWPEATIIEEIGGAKRILDEHGIYNPTYIYPTGTENALIREIVSKYHIGAFNITAGLNAAPFDTFSMKRYNILSSTTLATMKGWVDNAISNNGCAVIFTHCYNQSEMTAGAYQNLSDLLDYIQTKEIEVVFPSEIFEKSGNIAELLDKYGRKYLFGADGRTDRLFDFVSLPAGTFDCSTGAGDSIFLSGSAKGYMCQITNTTGTPDGAIGYGFVLKTDYANGGTTFIFIRNASGGVPVIHCKQATSTTTWGSWYRIGPPSTYTASITGVSVPANSALSKAVTVPGLNPGDAIIATYAGDVGSGIVAYANVSAANNVKFVFMNGTASPITIPDGTWTIRKYS